MIHTLSNGVQVVNCTPHKLIFEDGTIAEPSGKLLQAKMEERKISDFIVEVRVIPTSEGETELRELETRYPEAIILGSAISAQAYPGRVKMVCLTKPRADVREKICRVDKFSVYPS
jgi:hypothetical protein